MRSSAAAHSPIAPQPPASTAMFRTSPRADPAHESPTKKAASSLRNFFFHSDEPQQTSPTKSSATQPADCVSPPAAARPASRRDTFQRANSHPVRLDASHALSASRAFDPSMTRAAALDGASSRQPQATPTLRSTVFGSCSHVLSAVIMALFQTVRTHHECIAPVASPSIDISLHSPPDSSTVRKAKLLYISLLEKAQKERGEWQGFVEEPHDENQRQGEDESALDTLTKAIQEMPKDEAFIILHELLGLSFRNLRVSLVCPNIYAKHKPNLAIEPLECPPSLEMLLRVREFISELSGDEKRCLLRLLLLWHAICVVDPINQSLKRLVEDKHSLILNESSEMEFVQQAARKAMRHDPIAVDLLVMMTHYRDVLFSELELFKIHREMQIEARYHTEDDSLCPSDGTQSEPHDDQDQDDHNNIPLAVPVMLDEATETDEEEPTAQRTSDTQSPVVTIQLGKGAVRPSRTSPSRKATKSRGHESSADSSRTKQPRCGSQRALDSAGTGRRSTSDKLNMKATRRTMLKSPRIVITPAVVATTRKEPVKKAKDNSDDHQWIYVCIGASVAIAAACTATMAVLSLRRHARQ